MFQNASLIISINVKLLDFERKFNYTLKLHFSILKNHTFF